MRLIVRGMSGRQRTAIPSVDGAISAQLGRLAKLTHLFPGFASLNFGVLLLRFDKRPRFLKRPEFIGGKIPEESSSGGYCEANQEDGRRKLVGF